MNSRTKPAYLILKDGTIFEGKSFGGTATVIGETVFTTSMAGYQEAITDSTNKNQLLAQTFPLIGNYGVNAAFSESDSVAVSGYIAREICTEPSNYRCNGTLSDFLEEHKTTGIYDIDTRHLTKILREKGTMLGVITTNEAERDGALALMENFVGLSPVPQVSVLKKVTYTAENPLRNVSIVDFGCKKSIIRAFLSKGCSVTLLPYNVSLKEITDTNPDGVFYSNGPGNPEDNTISIETAKALSETKIPTFGIGLGHQIMALAMGATVKKLKSGHRGSNQPVKDLLTGLMLITSQSHSYAVETNNVELLTERYINDNDKSNEGIDYKKCPWFSTQFHPETTGKSNLYDKFIELIDNKAKN